MYFVGFDPGGKNAFGWCVVSFLGGKATCVGGVVDHVSAAIDAAKRSLQGPPVAVGIDAPLFWVEQGDRNADQEVRALVLAAGGSGGTVGHVNSLRGACLAQGAMAAKFSADTWPETAITEAHPKALIRVCDEAQRFVSELDLPPSPSDHCRDAALAAFSAYALATSMEGWRDLAAHDRRPFFPSGRPVHYWFPEEITRAAIP